MSLEQRVAARLAKEEQQRATYRVWLRARRARARAEGKCIVCRKLDAKPECSCCGECIGRVRAYERRVGRR